jgi:hypothetical protein
MKNGLTQSIQDISDRKPLEQFAAASFRLLALLQSLPKNLQFDDTECPLDAKDQRGTPTDSDNHKVPTFDVMLRFKGL